MAPNIKQQFSRLNERRLAVREKRRAEREEQRALGVHFGILHWFGVRRTVGFLMLAGFIALRVWDPPTLQNLRLRNFDFYQVLKPRDATMRPVVIVDIDEASLTQLGQWPWPRTLIAELVDKLQKAGTAVIGFDIMLAEPDRMSPASVALTLPQIDEATREKMMAMPSNDDVLATAIANSKVVLGQASIITPTKAEPDLPRTGLAMIGGDPSPYLFDFAGLLRNIPVLEKAAAGRGSLTLRPERDGVVRRVPMVMKAGGEIVPALTLDMLRDRDRIRRDPDPHRSRRRHPRGGGAGTAIADRRERPALDQFRAARSGAVHLRKGRFQRQFPRRPFRAAAGADRHLGRGPARPQGDAARNRHARRRGACADSGECVLAGAAVAAELCRPASSSSRRRRSASSSSFWHRRSAP